MDVTNPINCQVGAVSHVCSLGLWPSTISKLGVLFSIVGTPSNAFPSSRRACSSTFCCLFLDVFMPGVNCRYAIDYPSHVCVLSWFHVKTQVLISVASIAIWKRNKVVVTLTVVVWGTGIGFHFYSKFLPLSPVEDLESHINMVCDRHRAGE